MHTRFSLHFKHIQHALLTLGTGALLAACGGATFQQTQGLAKQRPLKPGTKVQVVESAAGLPQPTLVVGTLKTVTKNGEADRPAVEKEFRVLASGKGCDAVAGLKLDSVESSAPKKVYHKLPDGKVEQVVENVTTVTHTWLAECVRSAAADSAPAAGK